jgi:hypothetical protein
MFVEIDWNKFVNLDRVFAIRVIKTENHNVCRFYILEGLEETSRTFETEADARKWLREEVLFEKLLLSGRESL